MILFWTGALALTTLLYVLLDGFDLGVGILFGLTRDEEQRADMLGSIAPVWDGNETWLVLSGTILFGAFPKVYATLLSAFYLPLVVMLCALILRGVAFEFRYKALAARWVWDWGFAAGSLVATFIQGVTVGALVKGLPIEGGHYVGGMFDWASPFALLCGLGLCLGYALLGAGWIIAKCEGALQDRAFRLLPGLTFGVAIFLVAVFVVSIGLHLQIMDRWMQRPYLAVFPLIGAIAGFRLIVSLRRHDDLEPFRMMVLIFIAAFGTLAVSFWPYILPFAITIDDGAAPPSSLSFMFWGSGLIVLPLTVTYTFTVYRIFSGKVVKGAHYH